MKILVTGAAGRLGRRLVETLSAHSIVGADVAEFDITDFAAARAFVKQVQPELVIHPAAWTDVDGCARDPEQAIRINGFGAQNIALAAAEVGAAILYVSSNEVFDGRGSRPYREYDVTNPINPYGYSKWVGEQAVMRLNPRHYVVRTSWLFAHGGKNFLQTIIGAAQAGKPLRVVVNEVANPTYNDDLAAAIAKLIESERYGIYHLTNAGSCSRYDFARYILDRAGFADTPITRITTQMWPRPSTPPEYSPLDNLAGKLVGITLRDWHEAVDAFLEKEGLRRD
ncbi:MAG TPA: dTDP-4-dehydrorhamnose reductase [Phototrophicaceae bacterium]|nr:dTDP-4-dehydrorhamnose reductase [Phototrophicaceae bacterium]